MHCRPRAESTSSIHWTCVSSRTQPLSDTWEHQPFLTLITHCTAYRRKVDIHTCLAMSQMVRARGQNSAEEHFPRRVRRSLVVWLSQPAILRLNTQESLRRGWDRAMLLLTCPKFSPTNRHTSKTGAILPGPGRGVSLLLTAGEKGTWYDHQSRTGAQPRSEPQSLKGRSKWQVSTGLVLSLYHPGQSVL